MHAPRYPITPRRPFTHRAAIYTVLPIHALRYPFTHGDTHTCAVAGTPFGSRRQGLYQSSDTCSRTAPSIQTPSRNLHGARCRSGIPRRLTRCFFFDNEDFSCKKTPDLTFPAAVIYNKHGDENVLPRLRSKAQRRRKILLQMRCASGARRRNRTDRSRYVGN